MPQSSSTWVSKFKATKKVDSNSVVHQPNGDIIVAGTLKVNSSGTSNFYLERLNPDGSLDTSFGNGGLAQASFSSGLPTGLSTPALYPQAGTANDGKIVVAGAYNPGGPSQQIVERFNSDGSLDTSFGNGGQAMTTIKGNVTEQEVKRAKDAILNSFVFEFDSAEKVLAERIRYEFYGYPPDFLERYRAGIEKVTPADVDRVARKYVHPDRLAILVVGNAKDFDRKLTTFGTVTPVDISIPPPKKPGM